MNFTHLIIGLLLILFLTINMHASAQEPNQTASVTMSLTPQRCVALHQGQMCYQTIKIDWQSARKLDICLYTKGIDEPLRCWRSVSEGRMNVEFASDATQFFQLMTTPDKNLIAEASVEVAWVYKANTRRKTHWRLF